MTDLKKYDSTSERIVNTSFSKRFLKFEKILKLIEKENIFIKEVKSASVLLEDEICGYKIHHAISTWEVYRVIDVADMIINGRNEFIKNNKK